jgi:hypothetical protein
VRRPYFLNCHSDTIGYNDHENKFDFLRLSVALRTRILTSIPTIDSYPYLWLGVLGIGIGLRLLGLDKGIWLDEYASLSLVSKMDFLQALRYDDHPPPILCHVKGLDTDFTK